MKNTKINLIRGRVNKMEEKENSIKIVEKFNQENRYRDCGKINNAIDDVIQKAKSAELWKTMYENLLKDFENYKLGKDISYLENNHHKKLVEKSLGQIIREPENIEFKDIECKVIIHNKLFPGELIANDLGIELEQEYPRFISLKQIADYIEINKFFSCTVIAESTLSGAIYRYNNYNKKEWQLVGTMHGYA